MGTVLWQNGYSTVAKWVQYCGKMGTVLWQNGYSTPLQTLAVTGLAGCLKRRSLKKGIKKRY